MIYQCNYKMSIYLNVCFIKKINIRYLINNNKHRVCHRYNHFISVSLVCMCLQVSRSQVTPISYCELGNMTFSRCRQSLHNCAYPNGDIIYSFDIFFLRVSLTHQIGQSGKKDDVFYIQFSP